MEASIENNISYDDCVRAYYAELLESKQSSAQPTVSELESVSESAALFFLGETATKGVVESLSTSMRHPFEKLWVIGLLDTKSYLEWAYSGEHTLAVKQVGKALARKR